MSLPLEVVLELYDYKITDLVNKRKPQGGFKSVLELRDVLKNAALTPAQHKKFTESSAILAELVQEAILKKTRVESSASSSESSASTDSVSQNPQRQADSDNLEPTNFDQNLVDITGESSIGHLDEQQVQATKLVDSSLTQPQVLKEQAVKPQSVPPLKSSSVEVAKPVTPKTTSDFDFLDGPDANDDFSFLIEPDEINNEHSVLHEPFDPSQQNSFANAPQNEDAFVETYVDPISAEKSNSGTQMNRTMTNDSSGLAMKAASAQTSPHVMHQAPAQSDEFLPEVSNQTTQAIQKQVDQVSHPALAVTPATIASGQNNSMPERSQDDFDDDFGDEGLDDFDAIMLPPERQIESAEQETFSSVVSERKSESKSVDADSFRLEDFSLDDSETNVNSITTVEKNLEQPDDDFNGLIELDDNDFDETPSQTTLEAGMLDLGATNFHDYSVVSTGLVQGIVEEDFMLVDDTSEDFSQESSSRASVEANQSIESKGSSIQADEGDFMLVDDFDLDNSLPTAQNSPSSKAQTAQQVDQRNESTQNLKTIVPLDAFDAHEMQAEVMQPRTYSEEDDFDDDSLMVSGDGLFDDDFVKEISAKQSPSGNASDASASIKHDNIKNGFEALGAQVGDSQQALSPSIESDLRQPITQAQPSTQAQPKVVEQQKAASGSAGGFDGFDLNFNLDSETTSSQEADAANGASVESLDAIASDTRQEQAPEDDNKSDGLFGALGSIIMGGGDEKVEEHNFSHLPSNNRRSQNFDFMSNELSSVVESISESQLAEEEEELERIRALAVKVWLYDLRRELDKLSFSFRFEPGRNTVRLIYAIMRNLQRYSKNPDFAEDIHLDHFKVIEAFPDYDNPLVPLRRLEDIRAVTDVFVQTIFSFKSKGSEYKHLKIPQEGVLEYLQKFAYLVAENPYAGKMTLIENSHPESQRIKEAIQMVEMDDIGFEAKRIERARLEKKLANALSSEEANSSMFKRDLRLYHEAVTNLFRWLYILLPSNVGGMATLPKLEGDIIAAKNPALKRYRQATDSDAITLQLSGPVRCHLDSLEVAVIKTGNVWDLFCGEESTELNELTQIDASGRQIEAFVESDYLHLRVANKSRTLPQLLSEGLLLHWMIVEEVFDDFAMILKFITNISASTSQLHMIRSIRQFIKLCEQSQNSLQAMMGFVNAAQKTCDTRLTNEIVNEFFQKIELLLDAGGSRLTKVLEFFGLQDSKIYLSEILEESENIQFSGKAFKIRKLVNLGDTENLLHTGFALRTTTQLENEEMFLLSTPDGPIFVLDELSLYDIKRGYVLFAQSGMQVAGIFLPSKEAVTADEVYS